MHKTFDELEVGQEFDFIAPQHMRHFNSFFLRCRKTGPRTYVSERGHAHQIGSVRCPVYNIGEANDHTRANANN